MIDMEKDISKDEIKDRMIHSLIDMQIFKMSDGRQLYEASLEELKEKYEKYKQKLS